MIECSIASRLSDGVNLGAGSSPAAETSQDMAERLSTERESRWLRIASCGPLCVVPEWVAKASVPLAPCCAISRGVGSHLQAAQYWPLGSLEALIVSGIRLRDIREHEGRLTFDIIRGGDIVDALSLKEHSGRRAYWLVV
jgi:hypothetical protein